MSWQCAACNHWTADNQTHVCINDKVKSLEEKLRVAIEALESSKSMISCIKHNCPVDALFLALDVSSQVVVSHIDHTQKTILEALIKLKGEGE